MLSYFFFIFSSQTCTNTTEEYVMTLECNGDISVESKIPLNIYELRIIGGNSIIPFAFYQQQSISHIEFPNSLETISEFAFSGCTNLTSINLSNNLTLIDNYAFSRCKNLLSIELPERIITISKGALKYQQLTLTNLY